MTKTNRIKKYLELIEDHWNKGIEYWNKELEKNKMPVLFSEK